MIQADIDDGVPEQVHALDGVVYRSVLSDDFEEIKRLHEEFFPVQYSDQFYVDACNGKGMRGGSLYSTVAVHQSRIVGFALAQLLPYPEHTEDKDLFPDYQFTPTYACYILTLGIVDEFRRLGLGTALIHNCEDHAKTFEDCGAVYLHVITSNTSAIQFYERNQYTRLRTIEHFYLIDRRYFSSYLYIRYLIDYNRRVSSKPHRWMSINFHPKLYLQYFIHNFNFSAILDFASVFVSHLLSLFSRNSMGIDATATQGDLRSTNKIDTNLLSRSPV